MRPHRRQPIRVPCPWDSSGKNTGVGCHFLLQCMKMKMKSESEVAQSFPTLSDPMDYQAPPSLGFSRQEHWSGVPLRPVNTSSWPASGISRLVSRGHCGDSARRQQQEAFPTPGSGPPRSSALVLGAQAPPSRETSSVRRPGSPIRSCF